MNEHNYLCLPEHARSFAQTKLVLEIYTKDEINEMLYGVCVAQEKNEDDFQMKFDGVYYPLHDSISWGLNRSRRNQCLKVPEKYFSQYRFRIIFIEKVVRRSRIILSTIRSEQCWGQKGYLEINVQKLCFCTKSFSTHSRQNFLSKILERNGSRNQTTSQTRSFGPFEVHNCIDASDV